jgi:hypothetical protein
MHGKGGASLALTVAALSGILDASEVIVEPVLL